MLIKSGGWNCIETNKVVKLFLRSLDSDLAVLAVQNISK
jgi:hypothetical protein